MSNFLAFDLGASSGRGIIGSLDNGKLELREIHRFHNGPIEKSGSLYWDYPALCQELLTGIEKALAEEPQIDAISIDTWGVDYVLFDLDTHQPKRLPYNYRDLRTERATKEVWKIISQEDIYALTGIQCMPLNTVYQLYAHKLEHPEDFINSVFLPIPDALSLFLGGDFTAEYTHVSTTNLLDPQTKSWCWELIDKLELPRTIFPEIVSSCKVGGSLKKELQQRFHCGPIPIVKCGSHDTASAVLAMPAPEQGNWAYVSAGTWALLGVEADHPLTAKEAGIAGLTNEGGVGGKIRFLTNIMGSWLFQETRRVWNENGRNLSFGDLENFARNAEPLKYLINPNFSEFAPPGDMAERIRNFCGYNGQGIPESDGAVVRAIYDSLSLCIAEKLTLIENLLGVKYTSLNIAGGGTKDEFLMQLVSDALNRPVIAGPVEATATGNILGQALALGEINSIAGARKIVRNSFAVKTYTPKRDSVMKFEANRERFHTVSK